MRSLHGKRVMVTGGSGFLGSRVVARLAREEGCEVFVPRSREYDLVTLEGVHRAFDAFPCDVVVHGAADYGGIWINQIHPGRIYYRNLVMGAHLMEVARQRGVEKFVALGTACSYPGNAEGYLRETELWSGACHDTVFHYGLTKKCLVVQGQAYRKEYGFQSIHLILTNLYGPGDVFTEKRAHVVSALIKRFVEGAEQRRPTIEVWGTGKPVREFLYVDDCAEAIVRAIKASSGEGLTLNIGTGIGTSIQELVEALRHATGYEGDIVWNPEKPDGAMFKVLDVSRMRALLEWTPPTSLSAGLTRTIAWYREHKREADARA